MGDSTPNQTFNPSIPSRPSRTRDKGGFNHKSEVKTFDPSNLELGLGHGTFTSKSEIEGFDPSNLELQLGHGSFNSKSEAKTFDPSSLELKLEPRELQLQIES